MFHGIAIILNSLKSKSLLITLIVNLLPVAGVIWFDWNISNIIILYYLESVVMTFFSYRKIKANKNDELPKVYYNGRLIESREELKKILASVSLPFYIFAFLLYSLFVLIIFLPGVLDFKDNLTTITKDIVVFYLLLIGNFIIICFGYWYDYQNSYIKQKGNEKESLGRLFDSPFSRILVIHITIVIGGFGLGRLGPNYQALIVFIAVKTVIDVISFIDMKRNKDKPYNKTIQIHQSKGRTLISYD